MPYDPGMFPIPRRENILVGPNPLEGPRPDDPGALALARQKAEDEKQKKKRLEEEEEERKRGAEKMKEKQQEEDLLNQTSRVHLASISFYEADPDDIWDKDGEIKDSDYAHEMALDIARDLADGKEVTLSGKRRENDINPEIDEFDEDGISSPYKRIDPLALPQLKPGP